MACPTLAKGQRRGGPAIKKNAPKAPLKWDHERFTALSDNFTAQPHDFTARSRNFTSDTETPQLTLGISIVILVAPQLSFIAALLL